MKIIEVEQNTPEWFAVRCGIPTSSNFDKILTIDGKPSKQRTKYMYQLAGERITGIKEESFQSQAMLRGIEVQEEAKDFYEMVKGVEVQEVGFCLADGYGCSPDGFVGEEGLIEIKCPIMSTHVGYLLSGSLPTDYFQQVQGQLYVTGRKWVDFISYYPGMKPLIVRVNWDESFLNKLSVELKIFCSELEDIINKIK